MKMTEREMIAKLLEILPNMSIGDDEDGQIIVYTDMKFDKNDFTMVVPFDDEN